MLCKFLSICSIVCCNIEYCQPDGIPVLRIYSLLLQTGAHESKGVYMYNRKLCQDCQPLSNESTWDNNIHNCKPHPPNIYN